MGLWILGVTGLRRGLVRDIEIRYDDCGWRERGRL